MNRLGCSALVVLALAGCVISSGTEPPAAKPRPPRQPARARAATPAATRTYVVPDLATYTPYQSWRLLRALGVTGDVVFAARVPDPPGRSKHTAAPITIAVTGSDDGAGQPMPDLVNYPLEAAVQMLIGIQYFAFTIRHVEASANCPRQTVCAQSPAPGKPTRRSDPDKIIVVGI